MSQHRVTTDVQWTLDDDNHYIDTNLTELNMTSTRNDRSEYAANLSLVAKYSDVQKASWMTPARVDNSSKYVKPSLLVRVLRFLGV